jgi:hypothetical protein
VHGRRGDDPTETGDEPPYAYPAVHHDPGVAALKGHWETQGWKPFSLPLGVKLDQAHPVTSTCIKCKTCGGYPCLLRAKCDARTLAIEPLMALPNVTLLTGRKVLRLETDPTGKTVTEVVCQTKEGEERWSGDIVVLAAGAANTAVVLLQPPPTPPIRTAWPMVRTRSGRNYMFHNSTAMVSVTRRHQTVTFPKTLAVNDFYFGDPAGGYDLPMGHIQLLEYMSGQTLEGQIEDWLPPALVPDALSGAAAERMLSMLVISEDLPMPDNRVHGRIGRPDHPRLHLRQPRGPRPAGEEAQGLAGRLRRPRPPDLGSTTSNSIPCCRSTARPTSAARRGSAPTRRARCWTATARLTNWTTSMSSTPASSSRPTP